MASFIETAMNASSPLKIVDHPFYPLEVEIAAYLANEWTMQVLLSVFVAGILAVILGTRFVVDKVHPNLALREKAAIWWFVICTSPIPPNSHYCGTSADADASERLNWSAAMD